MSTLAVVLATALVGTFSAVLSWSCGAESEHRRYRQEAREVVGSLRAENEKLRKLVAGKIYCWHTTDGCKGCPLYRLDDDGWCDEGVIEEELGFGVNE